jgi:hypothetical protein
MPINPSLRKKESTPSRQVSGTSYTAQGAIETPPANFNEVGSQRQAIIRDTVPELGTKRQQAETYRTMVRSDASVRVSLRAGKAPVLGGDYWVEPFDDDPDNIAIAEFVNYNLFHGMTTPWLKVLEQILHMYEDGFSVLEPVWEMREWAPHITAPGANRRLYTMLRKLSVRPASTVIEFLYDNNGGPKGIKHNAIDAEGNVTEKPIDISKLVIFTFDQDGGALDGNSILRSAYPHWYYKQYLYKIDAIQKERHGIGVPEVELQPGHSSDDNAKAHELASNLRTNEKAYIVRTTMMTIGFAEIKGNLVDALESAQHHDNMIMKNIMVQFLNLGMESSGGGRATGATSMDMFLKSMRHIANSICESINMYVIPNLVAYNFKTDKFPKLQVRNIGEAKDLQMFTSGIANLVKNNAIEVDDEFEQWVRRSIQAPRRKGPLRALLAKQASTMAGTNANGKANGKAAADANRGRDVQGGNTGKSPSSGE